MRYYVTLPSGRELPVDVTQLPSGELAVAIEGRALEVDAFGQGASTHVRVDGCGVDLRLEGTPPDVAVLANGRRFSARVESQRARDLHGSGARREAQGAGLITSPMPGRVLKVLVSEGDEVAAGAPLVVVEAMKMENELSAARIGTVKKIYVTPGSTVESGARLIEVG
jgi:glutaconyl-CoA/methylmalonyl-CoA decarboxylase subunit gamma